VDQQRTGCVIEINPASNIDISKSSRQIDYASRVDIQAQGSQQPAEKDQVFEQAPA
jgi:hypothetical protein